MVKGEMKCLGNQQHLKSKFGGGYKLFINFDDQKAELVRQFLEQHLPTVQITGNFKGSMELFVPHPTANTTDSMSLSHISLLITICVHYIINYSFTRHRSLLLWRRNVPITALQIGACHKSA